LAYQIQQWVIDTKKQIDPHRRSLILFYYFGHGLADGMSKSVFLVPEGFIDDPHRRVTQLQDRLLSVEWLISTLNQASDRLLLMIDACRQHGNEDQQLVNQFPGTPAQKGNLADILSAVQFSNELMGPQPVLFASADSTNAHVVDYERRHLTDIGPLAHPIRR
jgi:hypothetical protein